MKKSLLIVALFLLSGVHISAQLRYPGGTTLFDGIHNFKSDSVLAALVKQLHVKSITQLITTKTYSTVYGEFIYNEKGQLTGMRTQSGRTGYEYDGDVCVKFLRFKNKDSAESWENYVYDEKKRLLKTEQNYYQQGKLTSYVISESKLVAEEKDKTCWESTKYGYNDIYTITYSLDSTANNMHYYIEYEYRPKDVDEKGRKRGDKRMTRSYTKNNCRYEDIVKYKVYGRIESPDDIKTYYYQGDDKGRLIEFGEIDYDPAMEQFFSEHPEEFTYGALPPSLIRAILNGQLKTARRPKIKQVYDAKGRIIEKSHYDTRYTFTYNSRGLLAEQLKHGDHPSKDELFYNDNGLVTRVLSTSLAKDAGGKPLSQDESTFTYLYY